MSDHTHTTANNTAANTGPAEMKQGQYNGNGASAHSENGQMYQGPQGYQGSGGFVQRFITPGGNPIDATQPAFPIYHRRRVSSLRIPACRFGSRADFFSRLANPSPLGLMGFGATTFVLSMYNVQARGITEPNVVLGMALGYGGLVQLIAGIQEFVCGNTFAATAFSSYGGFWLSFASELIEKVQAGAESRS